MRARPATPRHPHRGVAPTSESPGDAEQPGNLTSPTTRSTALSRAQAGTVRPDQSGAAGVQDPHATIFGRAADQFLMTVS